MRGGGHQSQRAHPRGIMDPQALRRDAAQRQADHMGGGDRQGIHEPDDIFDQGFKPHRTGCLRTPVTPRVIAQDAAATGQSTGLRIPHFGGGAERIGKDHNRRAFRPRQIIKKRCSVDR